MFGDNKRNLIIAIVVSLAILIGFQFAMPKPEPPPKPAEQAAAPDAAGRSAEGVAAPSEAGAGEQVKERAAALAEVERVTIDAPKVHGSLALKGARLDDLTLREYRETIEPNSPEIVLLSPNGTAHPYFAEFGWLASDPNVALPDAETRWTADRATLTPETPVTLSWDNGQGLVFTRRIEIDDNYLFSVSQKVENRGERAVELFPYGQIQRIGFPAHLENFYVLHEGPLGILNETLIEESYNSLLDTYGCSRKEASTGGWLGITDKYWLTALIPDQSATVTAEFGSAPGTVAGSCEPRFKTNYVHEAMTVAPGGTIETANRLFAGAKVVQLLNSYKDTLGVPRFDDAVDFGWLWFLTKPMFYIIDFFYRSVGNFGVAILLLTVCVRILLFPLANKAYVSMSKMRKLQPEMLKLRERFKDDKVRFQQETMALYKREKANPISGCFPILVQIPVFFALYKVLLVSLEMRHAPFFWWIQDLSAPDPMTIITGFGYLDWPAPQFLMIGVWPLIYAFTLFLQQKLNPQPMDPMQAKILLALPLIFLFMFAHFPAGLVIYWTWNNVLSITQQYAIMRRIGVTKAALHKEHAELQALKAELASGRGGAAVATAGNPGPGGSKQSSPPETSAAKPLSSRLSGFRKTLEAAAAVRAQQKGGKAAKPAKKTAKPSKSKTWPKDEPEVETRQVRRAKARSKTRKRP
ncbi:MAG: membrane protein insertase YidC [Alphaproteobacteria bacterium]